MKTIISNYINRDTEWHKEMNRLENIISTKKRHIEKLKKKITNHYKIIPKWTKEIIEPIAIELLKFFPDRHYKVLGPFGICCRTSIHLTKNGVVGDARFENDNIISVEFYSYGFR